jgi:RNA polymerase sigma factor (sigma-70 family)
MGVWGFGVDLKFGFSAARDYEMQTMLDDAELLRRYTREHSETAFTEFVERHLALVYFTAMRGTGGDSALAHDVSQAVFVIVAQQAPKLIAHPALVGWLHTTARNVAARTQRKEQTRRRYEAEAAAAHAMTSENPAVDWERLRPVIDDALGELEPRERDAILVRFFAGRAFAEMGEAWRISPDGARMRVDRALEKLRVVLARRGVVSVAAALGGALGAASSFAAPAGLAASVSQAALAAPVAAGGVAALFSFMSGTKLIVGAAAVITLIATGTAVLEHRQARSTELRLEVASHQLAVAQAQIARAEKRSSTAEKIATESEDDTRALLAAVQAAHRTDGTAPSAPSAPAANSKSVPNDALAQTLDALFPSGIVAVVGERKISAGGT